VGRGEIEQGTRKKGHPRGGGGGGLAVAQYLRVGELGQATQEALQLLQLHLLPLALPSPSPLPLSRCRRSARRAPWNGEVELLLLTARRGEADGETLALQSPDSNGAQRF